MNRIALALLICLVGPSISRADELVLFPAQVGEAGTQTPSRAIGIEASRLAKSAILERRAQSTQNKTDTRPWCFRHGAACGALIGYGAGFVAGMVHPASRDMSRFGWAFLFGAPIGAGIGAVIGCCISHEEKVQRQP